MKTIPLYELRKNQTNFPCVKISDAACASDFIRQFYGDDLEIFESVFVLLMSNANKTIGYAKISQGGITGSVVDVRIVCKYAIDSLAVGVIVAHNHPSGTLKPSQSDLDITKKLSTALKTLDVVLLDHVILTADGFYSMKNKGDF